MRVDEDKLSELLVDSGLVSNKDIKEASAAAEKSKGKQTIGEILVSSGKLEETDLVRLEAYVLGIPFVDLREEQIEFEVLSLIPEPIARTHNIVAFKKTDEGLEVAMVNPKDLEAIDFIKRAVNLKILPRLTDHSSIKSVLLQYQKSLKAEFGDIIASEAAPLKAIDDAGEEQSEEDLQKLAEDLPVVRIVDTLLNHAILQKASDIHIEPLEKELLIRYRIDGILHDAMVLPKAASSGVVARVKVLAKLRLDEKRLPQDGRFKIEQAGARVSFRVSSLPTYYGEKVVMRLLPDSGKGFTLESLGFYGDGLERIQDAIKKTTGLILATGPTGSGKTTTLYTVLEILNKPDVNISTIEDPIEYQMPRINQTQVKPDIDFTFATGLRSLLRQDPDILMVGEIRDSETVRLAINAALTGHLVLSTLHTNSAAGAVARLVDMGAERFLLTSTVQVIIAQRLVRRLCKETEKYKLKKSEIDELKTYANLDLVLDTLHKEKIIKKSVKFDDIEFHKAKKSKACEEGYEGRIGIHEILPITKSINDLISSGADGDTLHEQARKEGMLTMVEDGIVKAAQGLTTLEEVFRVANS